MMGKLWSHVTNDPCPKFLVAMTRIPTPHLPTFSFAVLVKDVHLEVSTTVHIRGKSVAMPVLGGVGKSVRLGRKAPRASDGPSSMPKLLKRQNGYMYTRPNGGQLNQLSLLAR